MLEKDDISYILNGTESFRSVFRNMAMEKFDGNIASFARASNVHPESCRGYFNGKQLPSPQKLGLLLDACPDEGYRLRLAASALRDQWNIININSEKGQGGVIGIDKFLEVPQIPSVLKDFWKDKLSNYDLSRTIMPEDFYKDRKAFIDVFRSYLRSEKSPTLAGFFKNLMEEWKVPNLYKLSAVLGLKDGILFNIFSKSEHNPEKPVILMPHNIATICNSRYVKLNETEAKSFTKFAKGNLGKPSVESLTDTYSEKILNTQDFKERYKLAKAFFADLIDTTGYKTTHICKTSGLPESQVGNYVDKRKKDDERFFGGLFGDPKDAFALAKAFSGSKIELQKRIAGNFLCIGTFKEVGEIKRDFFEGNININQVFLLTRTLAAKSTLKDFATELGLLTTTTLHKFEKGEKVKIAYNRALHVANEHLHCSKEELNLFKLSLMRDLKASGVVKDGSWTEKTLKIKKSGAASSITGTEKIERPKEKRKSWSGEELFVGDFE